LSTGFFGTGILFAEKAELKIFFFWRERDIYVVDICGGPKITH